MEKLEEYIMNFEHEHIFDDTIDPRLAVHYQNNYYAKYIFKFAKEEEYKNIMKKHNIDIDILVAYANELGMRDLCNMLVMPLIDKNIKIINENITQTEITYNDLCIYENTPVQNFILTQELILNLTFDCIDPLILFERFLSVYSLFINTSDKKRFSITITNPSYKKETYYYDDIVEILSELSEIALPVITKTIKDKRSWERRFIKLNPSVDIDLNYIQTLSANELFDYLYKDDIMKINTDDLKYLYLLLNFQRMKLNVKSVNNRIEKWIKYNQRYSRNFEQNYEIFCGFEFSIDEIK